MNQQTEQLRMLNSHLKLLKQMQLHDDLLKYNQQTILCSHLSRQNPEANDKKN